MATVTKPLMLDETGQDILSKLDDIMIATPVVDNCSTADPVKALSANQGKILNETTVKFTNEAVGSVTPINAAQLNGHTDEYFAKESDISHIKLTKIWENPYPTAEFAGQDVSLGTSGHEYIIYYVTSLSHKMGKYIRVHTEETDPYQNGDLTLTHAQIFLSSLSIFTRSFAITYVNGLSVAKFLQCLNAVISSGSVTVGNTNNSYLVPMAIYEVDSIYS